MIISDQSMCQKDRSSRHTFRVLIKILKIVPIMLALCLMLLATYYA